MNIHKLSLKTCQSFLHPRKRDAQKGDFGHVLVVGGDYGMGGAPRLAAEAALRSGAGLVSVATHPEHAFAMIAKRPELMAKAVTSIAALEPLLERATVVIVGPGLGQASWGRALFKKVLETQLPLVVDADALNLLSEEKTTRDNWILSPHPGEAARLLGCSAKEIQADRLSAISRLQDEYRGVIVLKGAGTLVSGKSSIHRCDAGNPGMATAGMGDVLAGILGGLLAEGLLPEKAACLGVSVHAAAGDAIAKEKGERGMIAGDLLKILPRFLNP